MSNVHILHENSTWVAPLRDRLDELGVPFEDWDLVEGTLDIDTRPPEGVFYNRMSASSHTRGHRHSPAYAAVVLSWLEAHGRRVVNDSRALGLEINKAAQYQLLKKAGVATPPTTVAVGKQAVIDAAAARPEGPVILKPNRGGKGDGVRLFAGAEDLASYVNGDDYVAPVDGVSLVQDYIHSPEGYVVRCEFVGGRFFYAVRIDTGGAFELCPADVCQTPDQSSGPTFRILEPHEEPPTEVIQSVARTLVANGVEVAGVEFICDAAGNLYAYDINTNTNYNPVAEARAGKYAMKALAVYLRELLETEQGRVDSDLLKAS